MNIKIIICIYIENNFVKNGCVRKYVFVNFLSFGVFIESCK